MSAQRYLVTARKYRPQRFEDLVAQEHVTETLKNAIRFDRLAHAYLFSGPRGVGKTTVARILAKAINCTTALEDRPGNAEPCRTCESCRTFEEGRSLNIIEIDAASNNKVDDVRELRDTVRIHPQGGKKKVYIVDEVHMLSTAAFNALLKTLEEPPPYVLFIFATTEPHKVLPTILSRCQRFDFRRIAVPEIISRLQEICGEEDVTADEASLMLIARKGDGALRDALSIFDQAVSLCGSDLRYGELAQALGVVDVDLYFEVTHFIAERDSARMLHLVDGVVRSGYDLQEFLVGLAEHLRNLLVARSTEDTSLIEDTDEARERYEAEAIRFTEADLLRLLTLVADAEDSMKSSARPRLNLETALLKMASISLAADLRKAIEQIERLESMAREGKLTHAEPEEQAESLSEAPDRLRPESRTNARPLGQPSERSERASSSTASKAKDGGDRTASRDAASTSGTTPSKEIFGEPAIKRRTPPPTDAATQATVDGDAVAVVEDVEASDAGLLEQIWNELLADVKADKIHVGSLLQHSRPEDFRDATAVIGVPDEFHHRLLTHQQEYLTERIRPLLSAPLRSVRFVVCDDVEVPDAQETASDFDPYEYMQRKRQENPVIRAIFDQFGGELVW